MSVLECCVKMGMHLGGKSISAAELRAARLYAIAKFNEDKPKKKSPEEEARRQKKYRTTNREAILAQRKVYYEQNGDKLRAAKRKAYRIAKEAKDVCL